VNSQRPRSNTCHTTRLRAIPRGSTQRDDAVPVYDDPVGFLLKDDVTTDDGFTLDVTQHETVL